MAARLVQQVVLDRFGLRSPKNWDQEFELALGKLGRRYNLPPHELVLSLGAQQGLLRELAGLLTIGETYFFRAREQVDAAVEHLERTLLISPNPSPLWVWSAGCASGEEPFSVAMALADRPGQISARIRILACDISTDAIRTARAGVYRRWSFRGVPEPIIQRHFEPAGEGAYSVKEAYRARVEFKNLAVDECAQELAPDSVAVVLFRNVGLYLEEAMLERCHRAILHRLMPGGLLLQASTDPVPNLVGLERVSPGVCGAYRKVTSTAASSTVKVSGKAPRAMPAVPISSRVSGPVPSKRSRPPLRRPVSYASELGGRGQIAEALELAHAALSTDAHDTRAYLVRAQLYLASGSPSAAIEDLRRALFLAPGLRLARYWYMVALQVAGQSERALGQLYELDRQLGGVPEEELLEDGVTTVGEMRRALATAGGFYE
jgi:chemotaxis protein methyltransferase CheR